MLRSQSSTHTRSAPPKLSATLAATVPEGGHEIKSLSYGATPASTIGSYRVAEPQSSARAPAGEDPASGGGIESKTLHQFSTQKCWPLLSGQAGRVEKGAPLSWFRVSAASLHHDCRWRFLRTRRTTLRQGATEPPERLQDTDRGTRAEGKGSGSGNSSRGFISRTKTTPPPDPFSYRHYAYY